MPKYAVFVKMVHLGKFVIEAEDEEHARLIMDSGEVTDDKCVDVQSVESEVTTIELADKPPFGGFESPRIPEEDFETMTTDGEIIEDNKE